MAGLQQPLLDDCDPPVTPDPDLEQPDSPELYDHGPILLESQTSVEFTVESYRPVASTFWPCTFNLSKVILGASMMAVPKAFELLGTILGTAMLVVVGLLTAFTVSGLVEASEHLKVTSYSAVVRHTCGRAAQYLLQVGIALTCAGNMVIYLVVIADVLVGSAPAWSGILPEILRLSPADHLLLSREAVLGMLCLFLLAPLVSLRNMAKLGPINVVGIVAVFAFVLCAGCLAVLAAAQGKAFPVRWEPDWTYFHAGTLAVFTQVAAIVPVLLNADICQQCVHPLIPLLKPYSRPRLDAVVAASLTLCNTLYVLLSVAMIAVFGTSLDEDALTNVSATALTPLVGHVAAHAVACIVRIAFLISLIGSFALLMFPLRNVTLDLLPLPFTPALSGEDDTSPYFYPVSWVLLGAIFTTAVYVPNIWLAISLVGSTCATLLAFIMPGLVILLQAQHPVRAVQYAKRALGAGIMAIGCFLFVNGVLTTLVYPGPAN